MAHHPRLSEFGQASGQPSPVARMMDQFAGDFRDGVDINLGVGYVSADTIPNALIERAMHEVLAAPQRYRHALNYGGPAGSDNLIAAIRRFHLAHRIGCVDQATLDRKRIIIGPSGATSLLQSICDVMGRGIVITSDPMYYIYTELLSRRGYQILAVPEDDEGIDTDRLRRRLDSLGDAARRISFIYLATVNNPTTAITSNPRRAELVKIAGELSRRAGHAVPVFFDTAYEHLTHAPDVEPPTSGLMMDEDDLVYEIGTFSKVLAPALRVGYLIGPDSTLTRALVQKTSDVGFSAPLLAQEMTAYLLDHHVAGQIERVRGIYRHKARAVGAAIDELIGEHVEHRAGGKAGFYYYLTLNDVDTHEPSPVFRFLTRTTGDTAIDGPADERRPRVIYLPGEYCVHPAGDLVAVGRRQLRLSYGFEGVDKITEALALMRQAIGWARG